MSKLRPGPPFFTRLLGAAVIAVVCFVLPVLALRWYQAARLEALFESYIAAPKRAIALDGADEGESMTRADVKWFPHGTALPLQHSALIEVRMNALRCLPDATVTFRYSRNDPGTDFTRTLAIPPSPLPEPTRLFFPVFDQFQGIEVNGLAPGCFAGVSQVANVEQFPLLFAATLSPRWKHGPLYQRLAFLER